MVQAFVQTKGFRVLLLVLLIALLGVVVRLQLGPRHVPVSAAESQLKFGAGAADTAPPSLSPSRPSVLNQPAQIEDQPSLLQPH